MIFVAGREAMVSKMRLIHKTLLVLDTIQEWIIQLTTRLENEQDNIADKMYGEAGGKP